jgi:hypothetical protein
MEIFIFTLECSAFQFESQISIPTSKITDEI